MMLSDLFPGSSRLFPDVSDQYCCFLVIVNDLKNNTRNAASHLSLCLSGSFTSCLFRSVSSLVASDRLLSHTCSKCTTKLTVTHANNDYKVFSVSRVVSFSHLISSVTSLFLVGTTLTLSSLRK